MLIYLIHINYAYQYMHINTYKNSINDYIKNVTVNKFEIFQNM